MSPSSPEILSPRNPTPGIDHATVRWADFLPALVVAAVTLALHLYTNAWAGYGIYRDELYYMVCSDHLAFGYVDHPPLSIILLAGVREILGDSLFAIRLLPALLHAVTVAVTGLIARELGAGRLAAALAGTAAALSPIFLDAGSLYSMNAIDVCIWTIAAWLAVRLVKDARPFLWLILGLLLGLGLQNKISAGWLLAGLFLGLLLTPHRRLLKTIWPWAAGVLALLLFLPYVIWNAINGFPHLEFMHRAASLKYTSQTPLTFLAGQLMFNNPFAVPLWLAGLLWLLFGREASRLRLLAFIYLTPLVILIINWHSKPEYLAPSYGILFAAGAVALDRWLGQQRRQWLKPLYLGVLTLGGLMLLPATLPILPVNTYIRYAQAIGLAPSTPEGKQLGELPQYYADMFGWEEKAVAVADVYRALPDSLKNDCAVFASNYGRCAAMDILGRRLGLPPVIGSHNNYWLWGPRGYTGRTMIILGGNRETIEGLFQRVEDAGVVACEYCMPYEDSLTIYICHNLKTPLAEFWPQLKHFE